ncbi:Gfo/Idh/MocA family oxidoreductase [Celeribacter arenosi]|uniref:Gfo/Idh/MocA family oxidoreductase n=1 Tax=Celeribacter arenosi TaxID=792649 RepID=A0ABP7KDV6_9RHOB
MKKLGVGIIGCGNISTSYLKLAPMFKALEVRAVADINMEAAKARADEYGVRAETVDDLLAADDIDLIINLTIPAAHFDITKRALNAGKHAYSEKPFVLTLEEGEELRAICEKTGLRVGSAPDTWMGGAHQFARHIIDSGQLGQITSGTAHVLNPGMEMWHPNPDFFFQPGGGPMLDLGPYYVTNLIQLLGPVTKVAALTNKGKEERTISADCPRNGEKVPVIVDTNVHALLQFASGAQISVTTSWDVWGSRHQNMELYGTEGAIYVPDPNFFGGTVETVGHDREAKVETQWDHAFGVPNQEHKQGMMANYRTAGVADMAQAIVEGRPHRCSLELALHAVEVMTAILKSGETGTFIDMTTTCTRPAAVTPQEAQALLG